MKRILALLILIPSIVYGQDTNVLMWDFDAVPSVIAKYVQSVTYDGVTSVNTPTCIARGTTGTTCSLPVPKPTTGKHVISVSAIFDGNGTITTVTGFDPLNMPRNITNIRLTSTTTITVP